MAHNGTGRVSAGRLLTYRRFHVYVCGRLSDGLGLVLYNRHVSAHFSLSAIISSPSYVVCSCLDSSMTEFGTFRVGLELNENPHLYLIPDRPL